MRKIFFILLVMMLVQTVPVTMASYGDGYDMVILASEEFSETLQPLLLHKSFYGVTSKIVSPRDIYNGIYFPTEGRDEAEQIKYFLKNAKENWGISYVLFLGNNEQIPARFVSTRITKSPFISDLYYADLYDSNGAFCSWDANNNNIFGQINPNNTIDNIDFAPDLYIGRYLCQDVSDVELIVNNIIYYETNTYGQSWFKNILLCGGNTKFLWIDLLFIHIYGCGGEIGYEGEYLGEKVVELSDLFNPVRCYASSFGSLTIKNINNAIKNGTGFSLFAGHGSGYAWRTFSPIRIPHPFPIGYTSVHVKQIDSNNKFTIAIFDACSCGDYRLFSPIAWEIIKNNGAIASFACTTESMSLAGSLCTETLSGLITMNIFKSYLNGTDILGKIYAEAITEYLKNDAAFEYLSQESHYECMQYWTLFGDPSLKVGGYPIQYATNRLLNPHDK